MNLATENVLRRVAAQAVSTARQTQRRLHTDNIRAQSTQAAAVNVNTVDAHVVDVAREADVTSKVKTIMDLPGPDGVPVLGTAPVYFRKGNRGQMHEVQVSAYFPQLVQSVVCYKNGVNNLCQHSQLRLLV